MEKILLGTTNSGKIEEMKNYLSDLDCQILTLSEVGKKIEEPQESHDTIEENAFLKARYYAKKTGLATLSDDGGLFIDTFEGWPGVKSARVADNSEKRRFVILDMLEKKENTDRSASFRTVVYFYDPEQNFAFSGMGITEGKIVQEIPSGDFEDSFGYDPIFFVNDKKKTYAEMSIQEKNEVSHRGKALQKIKYTFENNYKPKQIIVPFIILYNKGKVLMNLRNDPHREKFHKKWEFPSGGVESGESLEETVYREGREETGYEFDIITQLPNVAVQEEQGDNYDYQVCLIPFVCKPKQKVSDINDNEVLESRWFKIEELTQIEDLFPRNRKLIENFLPNLKEVVAEIN